MTMLQYIQGVSLYKGVPWGGWQSGYEPTESECQMWFTVKYDGDKQFGMEISILQKESNGQKKPKKETKKTQKQNKTKQKKPKT